jgi:hypothetical protein
MFDFLKQNWLVIAAIIVLILLFNRNNKADNDLTKEQYLKVKAELAHELSQHKVNKPIIPNIVPDDKTPELANCPICKGTKWQVHADGHKTPCPYHGSSQKIITLTTFSDKLDVIDQNTASCQCGENCPCKSKATVSPASKPIKDTRRPVINTLKTVLPPYSNYNAGMDCSSGTCYSTQSFLPNRPIRRLFRWR